MTIRELITQIDEDISIYLKNAFGLGDGEMFLPIYLREIDQKTQSREAIDIISEWIDQGEQRVSIAQISAPIGSGKTIITFGLRESLQKDCDGEKAVIWFPAKAIPINTVVTTPSGLLPSLFPGVLGIGSLRNIYCFILDGVDEFLSQGSKSSNRITLANILETLCQARIPIIISSRDVGFINSSATSSNLENIIQTLCKKYNLNYKNDLVKPLSLEILPWEDNTSTRRTLVSRLLKFSTERQTGIREEEIQAKVDNIRQKVLTTPLLFGLAYELIRADLNSQQQTPRITNEWELTKLAIDKCFARDGSRAQFLSQDEVRRCVAQRIALYLVCTGRGISGIEISELSNLSLHWIWQLLKQPEDSEKDPNAVLDGRDEELIHCCLLKACPQKRLAPFHQHILSHLAAEGFESLFSGETIIYPTEFNFPLQQNPWSTIGEEIGVPSLSNLGELISRHVKGAALNPNSDFEQALRYWITHQHPEIQAPNINLIDFYCFSSEDSETESALYGRRILGTVARFLKMLQPTHSVSEPVEKIEVADVSFIRMPLGKYLVWGQDSEGNSIPILEELSESYFLAEQLTTVGQYAKFLQDCLDVSLPNDPASNWQRYGNSIVFNQNCEKKPVCGISRVDAERYCNWLTQQIQNEPEIGNLKKEFRLPPSSLLKVAATRQNLVALTWHETGSNGHADLICKLWQHTNDIASRAGDGVVFGGSAQLAEKSVASINYSPVDESEQRDKAQKIYESAYPEGTREISAQADLSDCGFRVVVEIFNEEIRRLEMEEKNSSGSVMVASSPPPNNPPDEDSDTLTEAEFDFLVKRLSEIFPPSSNISQELEGFLIQKNIFQTSEPELFWSNMLLNVGGTERIRHLIIAWLDDLSKFLLNKNHPKTANLIIQLMSSI